MTTSRNRQKKSVKAQGITNKAASADKPATAPRKSAGSAATNRKSEIANQKSPRIILLAVSGMSPAILTETVWALAKEKPPVIPDEIVVLTTTKGANDITTQFLTERPAWGGVSPWATLRQTILGAKAESDPRLQFATPRVIELPDATRGIKRPADDLRTPADNAAAADSLLEEVRRLTENPDTHVIASIAGGRKTMGALLYAAISLLGRETDRLTHVLVSEPFDQCRDFFFPSQPLKEIDLPRAEIPAQSDSDELRKMMNGIRTKLKAAGQPGMALERALVSRRGLGFLSGTAFAVG